MRVTILYFAWVREAVGVAEEILDLPDTAHTPLDIIAYLRTHSAGHAAAFADTSRLRCAVDQTIIALECEIGDAREIAFFPPVTGG
ncbi:MAG: molybdopterin converting factor subunit 1 [Chakrabartia sp.]